MTQTPPDLRPIAHAALSLSEPPYLKHYRGARFRVWNGVAFSGNSLPGPGFNFAACLTDTPPLDDILPVAREFFADAADGWGVLVEGDAGHPVEAELRARGWAVAEDEPAFVIESLPNPPAPFPKREGGASGREPQVVGGGREPSCSPPRFGEGPGEGFRPAIRPVRTEADRAAYLRITAAAFGAPPEFADLAVPSLDFALDPDIALFVGNVGGEDVAAVGYFRVGPTAVVAGTATLEAFRGRGSATELLRVALADAAERGCTSAALRSGPKSVPLYERVGFRYVCQHRTYAEPGRCPGPRRTSPAD